MSAKLHLPARSKIFDLTRPWIGYWRQSDCSVGFKLTVYDAVVRSKLMYGLESAQLSDSVRRKLDSFQFKGLRKILKMKTTLCFKIEDDDFSCSFSYCLSLGAQGLLWAGLRPGQA